MFDIFTNYERRSAFANRHFALVSYICAVVIWAPFGLIELVALPTSLPSRPQRLGRVRTGMTWPHRPA
jgi:hypothetical protein